MLFGLFLLGFWDLDPKTSWRDEQPLGFIPDPGMLMERSSMTQDNRHYFAAKFEPFQDSWH